MKKNSVRLIKLFATGFAVLVVTLFCSCENSFFMRSAKIYKVRFSTNGGTHVESVISNHIEESPYTEKKDCDFSGWYRTSDFSGEEVSFPLKIESDTTLYAKWLEKYTVTFKTNGGSEVASFLTSQIEASPLSFKEDYLLEGWYENADFSGGKVAFPYPLKKPTILYAKWNRAYTATFAVDGGVEIDSFKAAVIAEAPLTTKNGFDFLAWYLDANFSGEAVAFPYTLQKDTTFYAKWAERFTVTFEVNGGSAIDSVKVSKIECAPVSIKNDADLVGWYENSDFSENALSFPYFVQKDTTLYARWNNRYTVTFNTDGGSTIASQKTGIIEGAPSATKDGHTLAGWYKDENFIFEVNFPYVVEENTTLYAKWSPAVYTISYNANGATSGIPPASAAAEHGKKYTIAENSGGLAKTGAEFVNWNANAAGTGKSYVSGTEIEVTENLTLYAKWMTEDEIEIANSAWSYPTATPNITWSGSGTEASPYIIKNAQQLADLAYMVNYGMSYSGKYFKLAADIDLNKGMSVSSSTTNAKEWHPIGNSASFYFAGTFDGDRHTIKGLYINSENYKYAGLFGYVSGGTVENITMGQGCILNKFSTAESCTGAIAGCLNMGTIISCGNAGTEISDVDSNNRSYVGGIVGWMQGGERTDEYGTEKIIYSEIYNCYNRANIIGYTSDGYVGGVIGYAYNYNNIYNSYNAGSLRGCYVGGILGYSYNSNNICNCYSYGKLDSTYSNYKGGILGFYFYYSSNKISYSYYYSATANTAGGNPSTKGVGSFASANGSVSDGYVSGGTVFQCLSQWVADNNAENKYSTWKEIDGWPALEWE